jgi:hypothetical protein
MRIEEKLASVPMEDWKVRQVVAFDWYDGPRAGVCAMAQPEVEFSFALLDERFNPDGLDDRLYRLSELPPGSVDRVLQAVQPIDQPVNPVWVPLWKFPTNQAREEAEQQIQEIESARRQTAVVLLSQDMEQFQGHWSVDPAQPDRADWFAFLGIPPIQPSLED